VKSSGSAHRETTASDGNVARSGRSAAAPPRTTPVGYSLDSRAPARSNAAQACESARM
jgi:hypothetical protein